MISSAAIGEKSRGATVSLIRHDVLDRFDLRIDVGHEFVDAAVYTLKTQPNFLSGPGSVEFV